MVYVEAAGEEAGWRGYLDGYTAGWRAAGGQGDPPEVSDDELIAASDLALSARVLDLAWRKHGLNDPTAEADDDLRAAIEAVDAVKP